MAGYPCPGPRVAPANHWEMYGVELALAEWNYQVHEGGLVYGPGPYPFHKPDTRTEQHPAFPLLFHQVPTGPTHPTGVRLGPDAASYSWNNEYVSLEPFGDLVLLRTHLFAGRHGHKIMVRPIAIELDLTVERITLPEECPPGLVEQATTKSRRALALLHAARAERDRGEPHPKAVLEPVFRAALALTDAAGTGKVGRA